MRDTIEMAREAGFESNGSMVVVRHSNGAWIGVTKEIERLIAIVRADDRKQGQKWFDAVTAQYKAEILAEREACAKVCDRVVGGTDPDDIHSDSQWAAFSLAQAIRARGETK